MKRIKIEGGKNLTGTVKISGAKNSVVAFFILLSIHIFQEMYF